MAVDLEVRIERELFTGPGWRVYRARQADGRPVRLVGAMPAIQPGRTVRCRGRWENHTRYGRQFRVSEIASQGTDPDDALVRYLASPLFPGVGPQAARAVIEAFGSSAIDQVASDPDSLAGIEALSDRQVQVLRRLADQPHRHRTKVELLRLGLHLGLAERLVDRYGVEAPRVLTKDPYGVASEVSGFGFKTADHLARQLGWAPADRRRIEGAIRWVLYEAAEHDGHTYLPHGLLLQAVTQLLRGDGGEAPEPAAVEAVLQEGAQEGAWRGEAPGWQLAELADAEERTAQALLRLAAQTVPVADGERIADAVERALAVEYYAEQRAAIAALSEGPVLALTGGPGTGKSTVVAGLIQATTEVLGRPARVLLCAPTARAADRLRELTGLPAFTIHRLLRWAPGKDRPEYGPHRPLPGDLLVVDEASMLDLRLAHLLLEAVGEGTRVALVGDADQLPPVGPGRVFVDVLETHVWAAERLRFNVRQADATSLAQVTQTILQGHRPLARQEGWTWEEVEEPEEAVARILAWVDRQTEAGDDHGRWLVLTAGRRGRLGTEALNLLIQQHLRHRAPNTPAVHIYGQTYALGDPVVQSRNNYCLEIFNGERGRVVDVDPAGPAVWVDFGGRRLRYPSEDLQDLELGYVLTVHKAQGGEVPHVLVVLSREHRLMLSRPLLFTAVSRARESCTLIAPDEAVARALHVSSATHRFSGLPRALQRVRELASAVRHCYNYDKVR